MNNKVEFISQKCDYLLELLKGDDHAHKSTSTLLLLLGLYIIVACAHFIRLGGTTLLIISIIALVLLMIVYRYSMQTAIKENNTSANYETYKEVDDLTYLKSKLQYLYSGVMVKFTRAKAIRILYVVMFPFILLLIREFFQGPSTGFGSFVIAFLLGGITWWVYFKSDLDDLEISRDDIKSYLEGV